MGVAEVDPGLPWAEIVEEDRRVTVRDARDQDPEEAETNHYPNRHTNAK